VLSWEDSAADEIAELVGHELVAAQQKKGVTWWDEAPAEFEPIHIRLRPDEQESHTAAALLSAPHTGDAEHGDERNGILVRIDTCASAGICQDARLFHCVTAIAPVSVDGVNGNGE
jgi:hypothetical protein